MATVQIKLALIIDHATYLVVQFTHVLCSKEFHPGGHMLGHFNQPPSREWVLLVSSFGSQILQEVSSRAVLHYHIELPWGEV